MAHIGNKPNSNSIRSLRRSLVALLGLAVVSALAMAAQRASDDAMRRAAARVEAAGSSLDPRQIALDPPSAGGNAHPALEAARRWLKNDDQKLYREFHRRLQREILKRGDRMTPEDLELFRRAIDHYGPVFEILDAAASLDGASFDFDRHLPTGLQLPYLNASEHFGDLLSGRAHVAYAEGRPADAWRDVRMMFRLAAWKAREMPILVNQLMAYTVIDSAVLEAQALLRGGATPDAETVAEIQATLAEMRRADWRAHFDRALEMERAEMVTWLNDRKRGGELIRSWFPVRVWPSIPLRPWRTFDLAHYAEAMTDFMEVCRRPAFERPAVAGRYGHLETHLERVEDHYPVPRWAPLTRGLLNAGLVSSCDRRDEALASLDMMETALRLESHRQSTGAYPLTLEDLGDVPIDPFSGLSFVYRPTATGAVLYGVGINRVDDGGEPHPERSSGDWNHYHGDRVWLLDSRGL
ncbi:MAG: hypothetical protein AAGM22_22745 [Acidobacteriota bacterium]